jgi:hypothetical protein
MCERNMRQLVMPVFEGYTLREITQSKVDEFITKLAVTKELQHGQAGARRAEPRLGLDVRYDALQTDPFRDIAARLQCSPRSRIRTSPAATAGASSARPDREARCAVGIDV